VQFLALAAALICLCEKSMRNFFDTTRINDLGSWLVVDVASFENCALLLIYLVYIVSQFVFFGVIFVYINFLFKIIKEIHMENLLNPLVKIHGC